LKNRSSRKARAEGQMSARLFQLKSRYPRFG